MLSLDPVLSLFIGLVLTFGSFSLLVSALTEAIASALALRSKTLVQGVANLLNDKTLEGYAGAVLRHAGVNPLLGGLASDRLDVRPSYIEPTHFAAALLDVLSEPRRAGDARMSLNDAINVVQDPQLRQFLLGLNDRARGDVDKVRAGLAAWFDSAMDRLSGQYKRRIQVWNVGVALALAGFLNIDAIGIAQQLWVQPGLARSYQPEGASGYAAVFDAWAQSFPFGWRGAPAVAEYRLAGPLSMGFFWSAVLMFMGWLAAALSTLFGAPFWFDALQQLVQIRSSGPSPREASAARVAGDGYAMVNARLSAGTASRGPSTS